MKINEQNDNNNLNDSQNTNCENVQDNTNCECSKKIEDNATASLKKGKITPFQARMITGFILCLIVSLDIYLLRIASIIASNILIVAFSVIAVYEMLKANKMAGNEPMAIPAYLSPILTFFLYWAIGTSGIVISLLCSAIVALVIFTFKQKSMNSLVSTISIMLYPQLFVSLFYILNSETTYGLIAVTLTLAVAILTDSMAMFTGMLLKGPKLCPTISPKKTISGAFGGIFGGIMGGMLTFFMFSFFGLFDGVSNVEITKLNDSVGIEILLYILIGIVGGIADQLGDLAASGIKRRVGLKDYSRIFPGHGGVMDRLDGMSFVLPVVYIFMILIF